MTIRSIMLLILTGLYFWACHYFMTCLKLQVCYDCYETVVLATPKPTAPLPANRPDLSDITAPIVFMPNSSEPFITDKFYFFKESISGRMSEDNILEITGFYYEDEVNESPFDNLGIARAREVKKLF